MASVAIMAAGAVLNAVAVIGGNYFARYLSGDDAKGRPRRKKQDTTKLSKLPKPLMPNTRKIKRTA